MSAARANASLQLPFPSPRRGRKGERRRGRQLSNETKKGVKVSFAEASVASAVVSVGAVAGLDEVDVRSVMRS